MTSAANILAVLAQAAPIVDSVALLRDAVIGAPVVDVLGFAAPGDGGAGRFAWAPTCILADDGGIVIMPTDHEGVGRWIRLIDGWNWAAGFTPSSIGRVNVRWFGAKGDGWGNGAADDTAACQRAAMAAGALGAVVHLYFPGDGAYVIKETLKLPANCHKFMLVSDPGVALRADFIASESRGAVIYCKDVSGKLFDLWNAEGGGTVSGLTQFGMQSIVCDASNGNFAASSTTCTGFIPSNPPGNPPSGSVTFGVRLSDCSFGGIATDGAIALDLSRYFWLTLENCCISSIANGIGVRFQSSYYVTTTVNVHKVLFQDCLEAVSATSNGFDIVLDHCCFESCYTAIAAIDSTVVCKSPWFENVGAFPGTRHTTITTKGAGGDPLSTVMFVRAGSLVLEDATFLYLAAAGANVDAWCECDGASVAGSWAGGQARFERCVNSIQDKPFFTVSTAIASRHGFSIVVDDLEMISAGSANGVGALPADARCVSRGWVNMQYGVGDTRRVLVRDGLFEYDGTAALTGAPTGGNLAGDRVRVPAPGAGEYAGYVCTAAGSPGTWKGYGAVAA